MLKQPANKNQYFWNFKKIMIADLLTGLLVIPPFVPNTLMTNWLFNVAVCIMWKVVGFTVVAGSMYCICTVCMDRYLLVAQPVWYRRHQSSRLLALMLPTPWAIPTLTTTPAILILEYTAWDGTGRREQCYAFQENIYVFFLHIVIEFLLPFIILTVFYLVAFLMLPRTRFSPSMNVNPSSDPISKNLPIRASQVCEETQKSKASFISATAVHPHRKWIFNSITFKHITLSREHKAGAFLFVLVFVFTLSAVPHLVMDFITLSGCEDCVSRETFNTGVWFLFANSTVNPILYALLHHRLRVAFLRLFNKR